MKDGIFFPFTLGCIQTKNVYPLFVLSSRLLTQGLRESQEDSHLDIKSRDYPPTL